MCRLVRSELLLSIERSRIEERKFTLLARFSPSFTRDRLIPEIDANCIKYQVDPLLVENYQRHRFSENSLYFHHAHAYADIPVGQEYEFIARMSGGVMVPDSILRCKTTILAFFSGYRTMPLPHANHGHHENCLIQFQNGIPDMIFELYEITDKTTALHYTPDICLCSYETLKANTTAAPNIISYGS